jgi:hypothetical protein
MTTVGAAFLVGASRRVGRDSWVSLSGGLDPADNPIIDSATFTKTVDLRPNAGMLLDRNTSLLGSLVTKGGSNNGATLNVYPGVIPAWHWLPGVWAQQIRGGSASFDCRPVRTC